MTIEMKSVDALVRAAIETGETKFLGRLICGQSRALMSLRWEERGIAQTLLRLGVQNERWKNGEIEPASVPE